MQTQLDSAFKIEGRWWLPGAEHDRHFGILSFDPRSGIELDLRGAFASELPLTADAPFRPPLILGQGVDGTGCSLIDTVQVGQVTRLEGEEQRTFHVGMVITGALQVGKDLGLPVRSATVRLRHLEEWLHVDPFRSGFDDSSSRDRPIARFNPPPQIEARLDVAMITISTALSETSQDERSFTWKSATSITYTPDGPEDLRSVLERLHGIQEFATLHVGSPAWILEASFDPVVDDDSEPAVLRRCYATFHQPIGAPRRRVHAHDTLVPYRQLQRPLGETLVKWFHLRDRVRPGVDLLLDTLARGDNHPVQRFLTVSRAFEMIHRGLIGSEYMDALKYKAVYAAVASAIPNGLPPGLRDRLRNSLKYGNEVSFRSRLQKALTSLDPRHRAVLFPDGDLFAAAVANTRNYFTHLTEELRGEALTGAAVAVAADRLQMLTWFLVMRGLGHTAEVLFEGIGRDSTWVQRVNYVRGRRESPNAGLRRVILAAKAGTRVGAEPAAEQNPRKKKGSTKKSGEPMS